MAGAVRQPIDVASLERYIQKSVPAIQVPIDVKQVRPLVTPKLPLPPTTEQPSLTTLSVRLRPVQSHLPTDGPQWPQIRHAQEATGQAPLEDGPQSGARIPHHPRSGKHGRAGPQSILSLRRRHRDRHALLHHGVLRRAHHRRRLAAWRHAPGADRNVHPLPSRLGASHRTL